MSESELYQLELLWKSDTTEEQYDKVVSGKTATLFQASAKCPCYLKNASENIVNLFANYGKNLGFAFQIFDDCLDYEGKKSSLGKPVLKDLLEGKVTIPLIFSLNSSHSSSSKLKILVNSIIETGEISEQEKNDLLNLVKETGGLEKAFLRAEEHSLKARNALDQIENMLNLSIKQHNAINALREITYFVLNRKN